MTKKKAPSKKTVLVDTVYVDNQCKVCQGELKRLRGRPGKTTHLFRVVGEKLPYEALSEVKHLKEMDSSNNNGIYIAHDSMGWPRYIGRGDIFGRLDARRKAQVLELAYFSFYVVLDKKHEREIETLLIRAAGPLLEFNTNKKRVGIQPGGIRDYEAGAKFYERQYKKGRKA